jgi:uncharacterized protein (TIGR02996 family)
VTTTRRAAGVRFRTRPGDAMSDDAHFLQAIRKRPADLAPRLVYADWLDERGDPRAEYLRVQCQAMQSAARLAELNKRIDPAWLGAVRETRLEGARSLTLRSGRSILLRELRQWDIYEGLLEGLPDSEYNRRLVEEALNRARGRTPRGGGPYLIPPTERPIELPRDWWPFPFGEPRPPAALPRVGCEGRFDSFDPTSKRGGLFSTLAVVWFQDEFGPIDLQILAHLRYIDWDQNAFDYDP